MESGTQLKTVHICSVIKDYQLKLRILFYWEAMLKMTEFQKVFSISIFERLSAVIAKTHFRELGQKYKIIFFVFGSNENFKICFRDLLTFSMIWILHMDTDSWKVKIPYTDCMTVILIHRMIAWLANQSNDNILTYEKTYSRL